MKIGDRVLIKGIVDEIRKDVVIIKNDGGYFGTVPSEIIDNAEPTTLDKIKAEIEQIKPYDLPCDKRTPQNMLDMALEIVEKYAEQEPCDDVVSRQAVLDQTYLWSKDEFLRVTNPFDYLRKRINSLPPVRPQEQTKEEHLDVFEVANAPWIFLDNCANSGYYCSKCKKKLVKEGWSETVKKINYCPNCGVCMKDGRTLDEFIEGKESEDKE